MTTVAALFVATGGIYTGPAITRITRDHRGGAMKLWKLARLGDVDYDVNDGFVIRAESELAAREMASRTRGEEGPGTWLAAKLSSCVEVTPEGDPEIILTDFNAG